VLEREEAECGQRSGLLPGCEHAHDAAHR
jgi:hypothetical protein